MALLSQNNHLFDYDVNSLSLTAPAGRSYLVKKVYVDRTGGEYATITIGRTKVGYFRLAGHVLGSHLAFPNKNYPYPNLLELLIQRGYFDGYPVEEGETFTVNIEDGYHGDILIVYDEYDAGDITSEQVNGSKSDELVFVNYGTVGGNVDTDGEFAISVSKNPAEFVDFPFGKAVPSGFEVDLLGLLYSDRSISDAAATTNYIATRYLKIIRERSVLFSDTKQGLFAYGVEPGSLETLVVGNGDCEHGDYSSINYKQPLWFPEGFTFAGGEELYLYWHVYKNAGNPVFLPNHLEIAIIQRVKKV